MEHVVDGLLAAENDEGTQVPDGPTLYDDRVDWIRRLCVETLAPLGEEFSALPAMVRRDIGPRRWSLPS